MKTLYLSVGLALSALIFSQAASAATQCKPVLKASGMYYTKMEKARSSAGYRWGLKASAKHGAAWAHVGQAKNKKYRCLAGLGKNKNLKQCILYARPCRKIVQCKGAVAAKGMFYKTKAKAKSSARYRWGLAAASKYGAPYGHWGKSKKNGMKCTFGHGPKGLLWNCRAWAKACK